MLTKDILRLVVFEYKACSLSYFLDEMQNYELSIILEELQYTQKQNWEQTRFISYIQAQTQSTKHIKPTDLLSFPWDKDERAKDTSISNEDIERLTKKMNKIINDDNKL